MRVLFLALPAACALLGCGPESRALQDCVPDGCTPAPSEGLRPGRFAARRAFGPNRTELYDGQGRWVATFTDGASSVTLAGPPRTLAEPAAAPRLRSSVYVRLMASPFLGEVDRGWVETMGQAPLPDVLDTAMEFVTGAPGRKDGAGRPVSGDASYGPLAADGTRPEGADFNDYLGVDWWYGLSEGLDAAEREESGSLDCSGFVRMVFGYRGGLPLSLRPVPDRTALPRRSFELLADGPGTLVGVAEGSRPLDLDLLAPGDLLFFDLSSDDGPRVDHVGIYLGRDAAGRARFVSSRESTDGPTLAGGPHDSVIDGDGLFARALRAARRL